MVERTSFPYRICYIEDSFSVYEPVKLGLENLLGAQVDLFTTTNAAREKMAEGCYNQWQVFIFDNRTGHGNISGIDLAQEVREKFPEAIVVSLNSSDFREMEGFGFEKLRGLGIEAWYEAPHDLTVGVSSPLASSGAKSLRSEKLFATIRELTLSVFREGG